MGPSALFPPPLLADAARHSLDFVTLAVDSIDLEAREVHDTFVYLWYLEEGHSHKRVQPDRKARPVFPEAK